MAAGRRVCIAYSDSIPVGDGNTDGVTNTDNNTFCYAYCDGDTFSDTDLPARRFAGTVDAGCASSDRSLRRVHG